MKITIAQGAFFPVPPLRGGAVEKVWCALGREFARRGHQVTHISRRFPGLPDEEVSDNVRHVRVRGFDTPRSLAHLKFLDLLYSLRARRVLPAADILVTNTFWLPMLVRSDRCGKLYVHIQRYPKGQMRFYRHAARLQTVSSHIRAAIVREVPNEATKTVTIPNPLTDATGDESATGAAREPWILYVGRIHPEKGIALLLEAAALMADSRAPWRLVLVGPADVAAGGGGKGYLAELQTIARPIKDRVDWIGPVFDSARLAGYYRRSSLFVYPSLAETGEACPLAPVEAMARGCPTLVSDLDCFRDYLQDSVTGFVFNHRAANPAAELAAKLTSLLADQTRLAAIGQAGHAKAADFSLDRVADRYLQDFQTLLDPK